MQESMSKLISLTFDESPDVRKQAAKSLAEIDDPAAIFALMELSYDKDPSVRDSAHIILDKRKQSEADVMSFAEIFSDKNSPENGLDVQGAAPANPKDKVLAPITRLFEKHFGKERADAVRNKMMPSIEKIYLKTVSQKQPASTVAGVDTSTEDGRKVMQEFLTSYLEVISDLDQVGGGSSAGLQATGQLHEHQQTLPEVVSKASLKSPETESEKESKPKPRRHAVALVPPTPQPIQAVEPKLEEKSYHKPIVDIDDYNYETIVELKEEQGIANLPDTFFKKAYETMMLCEGDEDVMKKEMKNMIAQAQREITLAFKFAKRKFKEVNLTNITKIKDGLRNIHTDVLNVKSTGRLEYKKGKKEKGLITRVLVNDSSGNEGVIYLFEDPTNPSPDSLKAGQRIKIVGGMAKSYDFSGETVMVSGKGNIYIVL